MPIERYEVKTFIVDFKCDVCGKGYFRLTGQVLATYPPQYPHKCNFCGAETDVIGHTYPYTETEKIKADVE